MKFYKIRKNKTAVIVIAVILMISGAVAVYAASPGSNADPVVTKSYVDDAIRAAISGGKSNTNSGVTSDSTGSYEIVHLKEGETLLGNEGTEMILRSGIASAIDNGENGVSDITSGKDLRTGDRVTLNHLLLVPRADGRGVSVSTEAYLMVRGGYSVK